MENVLGDTQKAFEENAKSASFKLTKALNTAKESFSQMGAILLDTLLPLIQNLTGVITKLFTGFNNLDTTMQNIILSIGLLIIALPTLLGLLGTLSTILGALLSPIGLVAMALVAVSYIIVKNWSEISPVLVDIYNRFVDLHNVSQGFRTVLYGLEYQFKKTFISIKAGIDQAINAIETFFNVAENKFNPIGMQIAIADGIAKSTAITKKAGEDLGLALAESIGKTLNATLENKTVDQLNSSLTAMGNEVKDYWNSIMTAIGIGGGGGAGGEGGGESGGGKSNIEKAAESAGEAADKTKEKFMQLALTSNMMGEQISSAFMMAFESMAEGENFFKSLVQGLVSLIKKLIAAAIAAFVLSTLLGGIGIKGIGKGVEGFKALFGSLSGLGGATKMANGGIVSSPTLGLMGEYPGAKSNPEIIAPLDKLKDMIGNRGGSNIQVGGQFVLKGQDLIVALERANNNRNRIL